MEVTKENVHDGKMLKELVHNVPRITIFKRYWQMVPMTPKTTLGT